MIMIYVLGSCRERFVHGGYISDTSRCNQLGRAAVLAHVLAMLLDADYGTTPVRKSAVCAVAASGELVLEQESSPQMQPGASRAAAAAAVHQYQSCTWLHDRHRCANRCALIRYA